MHQELLHLDVLVGRFICQITPWACLGIWLLYMTIFLWCAGDITNLNPAVQVSILKTIVRLVGVPKTAPAFLRKRRRTGRAPSLQDWVLPVSTTDEIACYTALHGEYTKRHKTDWTGMCCAFNTRALLSWFEHSPQVLYLKNERHLQQYEKFLIQSISTKDQARLASAQQFVPPVQTATAPAPSPTPPQPAVPSPLPASGLVLGQSAPAAAAKPVRSIADLLMAQRPPAQQQASLAMQPSSSQPAACHALPPTAASAQPGSHAPAGRLPGERACGLCSRAGLPPRGRGHNCALEMLRAGRDPRKIEGTETKLASVEEQCRKKRWELPGPGDHSKLEWLTSYFVKKAEGDHKRKRAKISH